ncbi:hypothetical protein NC981_04070 [Leptolyngbya sp. DQ-M1]|uniref:hypothetical protein n=1 Tax=Leptolyngbya sp. DQ-M1 TaxID=2933920 RepID=UPI00329A0759
MQYRYLLVVSALSLAFPMAASAAVYTTQTGQTRFVLDESNGKPIVEYVTRIQGRDWIGSANVSGVPVPESAVSRYQGTFRDIRSGGGAEQVCTGTIDILNNRPSQTFSVTWKVTGGKACPAIGQTTTLRLADALPRPDARGDFTPAIVNQWNGGTQSTTWRSWRVVSADGFLNCRATPNGALRKTYKTGTPITAYRDRSGLAMTTSNGVPWLRTSDNCLVRANSRYIQPTNLF